MATEAGLPSAVQTSGGDAEKMAEVEKSMAATKLNDNHDPVTTNGNDGNTSPVDEFFDTESKSAEPEHQTLPNPASVGQTLNLPLDSAAGLVKTPLAHPLDSAKPKTRPDLTADQEAKYQTLLTTVSAWNEIPTTAKGGKPTPLGEHEQMFMTRECLLRYLRADKWNVQAAQTRLKNTMVWRREYGIYDKHTPDYIGIENATGKQLLVGWDNEGRTCQYMRPSKQNTERSDRQIEHLVYMLERSVDLMPPGQETLTLIINFAETKSGQGATLGQGKQTLNILQNHYPERLGRALVTNVPWYIWTFFKLIRPFIDPLTYEKIRFNEDGGLHVPREQLLKESGGLVEFEYDHDIYWPALNKLCELKRQAMRDRWEKAGKRIGELEMYLKGGQDKSLVDVESEGKTKV